MRISKTPKQFTAGENIIACASLTLVNFTICKNNWASVLSTWKSSSETRLTRVTQSANLLNFAKIDVTPGRIPISCSTAFMTWSWSFRTWPSKFSAESYFRDWSDEQGYNKSLSLTSALQVSLFLVFQSSTNTYNCAWTDFVGVFSFYIVFTGLVAHSLAGTWRFSLSELNAKSSVSTRSRPQTWNVLDLYFSVPSDLNGHNNAVFIIVVIPWISDLLSTWTKHFKTVFTPCCFVLKGWECRWESVTLKMRSWRICYTLCETLWQCQNYTWVLYTNLSGIKVFFYANI